MPVRRLHHDSDRKGIARLLLDGGFVTKEQLEEARGVAKRSNKDLKQVLIEKGYVSRETMAMVLSFQLDVPTVDLSQTEVQSTALALVSQEVARKYNVLPLTVDGDVLTVATTEPENERLLDALSSLTKKTVRPVVPLGNGIAKEIDSHYGSAAKPGRTRVEGGRVEKEINQLLSGVRPIDVTDPTVSVDLVSNAPVVKAVEMVLNQAAKSRASDIHIVPQEYGVTIRYRIDGILHDALSLPRETHSSLLTRLKVMANMNIAERRRPQDGQFQGTVSGRKIDFRVATIGTNHGEMAVLRVLDKTSSLIDLSELGMSSHVLDAYKKCLASPYGMIMISGPTGSGKTTTLYSSMGEIRSGELNVMTIEDPVEYEFAGIHQIQVNRAADITFAKGLRSIMRLDPDVILVGEIRDAETANTAVQAALTGHLVLTSIHANDAAGAIVRLLDFGVEPFLVTSAVIAAMSQRLMRKVCGSCKRVTEAPDVEKMAYQQEMGEERRQFSYGAGCSSCSYTGFRGRIGAFELITMNDTLRRMVSQGAGAFEVKQEALTEGMQTMRRDGMLKVQQGTTTVGEVIRNVFSIG